MKIFSLMTALFILAAGAVAHADEGQVTIASPDGDIVVTVSTTGNGTPQYQVELGDEAIIRPSALGMRFAHHHGLDEGFEISGTTTDSKDQTWEQPWGERRLVRDHHNELLVTFSSTTGPKRSFAVRFRVFDDGVGFRYEVPKMRRPKQVEIVDELTGFALPGGSTAWWIPSRAWNRYEYIYNETDIDEIEIAHTPMTIRTPEGTHVTFHEAALVNYSGMSLKQDRPGTFKADLAPWPGGPLVKLEGAFKTPWRTIQIADEAKDLLNSDLILNLNEPNKLGDVSWVEPGKYVGIWWQMHIRERTWGTDGIHGANTEDTKAYIDFAAEHGFVGVLVEGWNIGWDGNWYENGDVFSFTEAYPDYDIEALAAYAEEKGVELIGHHETSGNITNYENQMDDAYDLYERLGITRIKTGYVADGGDLKWIDENGIAHYGWHDGQVSVDHHMKVITKAAEHKLSINAHEPIKDTGLRRTYPNWVAREGARGMEFDAWGIPPNPPSHTAVLPFTRMMSGPMDYTPGAFNLRPNELPPVREDMPRSSPESRIETTLAKQLALYVVIYSPIQMAADLKEHYEERMDAFQFIKDVPADWEQSIALDGEVGEYVVQARQRRGGDDWFLGALTNEDARELTVSLDFLDRGTIYTAQIYRDGPNAHYDTNPYDIVIEEKQVTAEDEMTLALGASGGAAIRFLPQQ